MKLESLSEVLEREGGSIKTGPFGTTLKAAEYTSDGAPVISVGEVGYGRLRLSERTPMVGDSTLRRLPEYVLRAGDIVFGRKGAVDRSAIVQAAEDGYFLGSDGIRLRLGPGVDSLYLAYQFQTARVRKWLERHAAGSTMPSLNQRIIEQVPVTLVDRSEQRAIVEVLGALDDKIASNSKVISGIVDLIDARFRATENGPGDATFADVADVGGGGTPKTKVEEFWGGEVQWATPTDVTGLSGAWLRTTNRMITESGLASCASPLYPEHSILMTSRATIGAFAVAGLPMAVNQGFIVVNAKEPLLQWWLYAQMRARTTEFLSHANGATFLELSRGRFKALPVWEGDADAVHAFCSEVDVLMSKSRVVEIENETLATTRDGLLPLLMSGKLRVKDAEKQVGEVV